MGDRGSGPMKESANYVKIVEWSEIDRCYVGSCPGLFYGGCHGPDERAAFAELWRIVEGGSFGAAAARGRSSPRRTGES
jgi:hypothetical protein